MVASRIRRSDARFTARRRLPSPKRRPARRHVKHRHTATTRHRLSRAFLASTVRADDRRSRSVATQLVPSTHCTPSPTRASLARQTSFSAHTVANHPRNACSHSLRSALAAMWALLHCTLRALSPFPRASSRHATKRP
eukprot:1491205-Rhodomonas_salina.2